VVLCLEDLTTDGIMPSMNELSSLTIKEIENIAADDLEERLQR
jgi:hypothetical protein